LQQLEGKEKKKECRLPETGNAADWRERKGKERYLFRKREEKEKHLSGKKERGNRSSLGKPERFHSLFQKGGKRRSILSYLAAVRKEKTIGYLSGGRVETNFGGLSAKVNWGRVATVETFCRKEKKRRKKDKKALMGPLPLLLKAGEDNGSTRSREKRTKRLPFGKNLGTV